MATSLVSPSQPGGVDLSLLTCGATQCSGRGTCRPPSEGGGGGGGWGEEGGGGGLVCDCMLGYKGERCEDTVNESLSVSLTLGVLAFIVGVILIAFILAKVRQRQKRKMRSQLMTPGYRVDV